MQRGGLIDDLIETNGGEIRKLHLDDWPHAFDGGADRQPDHRIFADGRINDPAGKLLGETLGRFKGAAERADILAVDEDAGVVGQGAGLGFADGFEVGDAQNGGGLLKQGWVKWVNELNG